MSIHSPPSTISYTFHDPQVNRYYIACISYQDATRLQTDQQFATEMFYRVKSIQDRLQNAGPISVRPFTQPHYSNNGQIHSLPNQTIVYLPPVGSYPRWFSFYPTPRSNANPCNRRHNKPFINF